MRLIIHVLMYTCIHEYLSHVPMFIILNEYERTLLVNVLRDRISEFSTLLDSDNLDSNNLEHKAIIAKSNFEKGQCERFLTRLLISVD